MSPLLPAWQARADVVIVGTGVAGLTAALDAAAAGLSVCVVTKGAAEESNTRWAQGGVAVVRDERDPGDTPARHQADTLTAAAGLADPVAVATILGQGPGAIARLQARGARFDRGVIGLARTREGGHSADRVIHAGGDATGAEIERALLAAPGLPAVLAGHCLLDVVRDETGRAAGITVLAPDGRLGLVTANAVVLATGGAGHLYASTTNPAVATGDGLAAALRAGAVLSDLEFFQFHPTVLWTGAGLRGHRPLITEAVRGEGAVLIDGTGARIMTGVHPLADLAPRDVVSLAISRRMAEAPGGIREHVYLDATQIPAATFHRRFPTVTAACTSAGIDPARDPIPVAPAAHYHCGGIRTDLGGRTSIPGLYAVGEVARTGLHGANRLASNSLLEGLVLGERVIRAIRHDRAAPPVGAALPLPPVPTGSHRARADLQATMSATAGIGRDEAGLAGALDLAGVAQAGSDGDPHASVEAANLALASAALLTAAAARTESRGCHVRTDHPAAEPRWLTSLDVRLADGVPVLCSPVPAGVRETVPA